MKEPTIILTHPGKFEKIDIETLKKYDLVERTDFPLLEGMTTSIEDILKKTTKWTDYNRPEKRVEDIYDKGNIRLIVTTTPQQKKPSWKEIINKTNYWTGFLKKDHVAGIK